MQTNFFTVAIPRPTRLFVLGKLKEQNIPFQTAKYDSLEGADDPQPKCTLHGITYYDSMVTFLASPLTEKEVYDLIFQIEKEEGHEFSLPDAPDTEKN